MNMKRIINRAIVAAAMVAAALCAGCEKKFSDPAPFTPAGLNNIVSIASLKAMYQGEGNPLLVTDSVYNIKGKVVSSDASGNIFNTIYIQEDDPGYAIGVRVARTSLFNFYPVGMILSVKTQGLTLGGYGTMLSLGGDSYYSITAAGARRFNENSTIGPDIMIGKALVRGNVVGMAVGDTTVITQKTDYNGVGRVLGRLVRIRATFSMNSALSTWAVAGINNATPAYGSQYLRFAGYTGNVGDIAIYTSGYSTFANRSVKALDGKTVDATGILTYYQYTSVPYQLVLNSDQDVVPVN